VNFGGPGGLRAGKSGNILACGRFAGLGWWPRIAPCVGLRVPVRATPAAGVAPRSTHPEGEAARAGSASRTTLLGACAAH
jgi:hypothetical protein